MMQRTGPMISLNQRAASSAVFSDLCNLNLTVSLYVFSCISLFSYTIIHLAGHRDAATAFRFFYYNSLSLVTPTKQWLFHIVVICVNESHRHFRYEAVDQNKAENGNHSL
jgi:hypothetical protein